MLNRLRKFFTIPTLLDEELTRLAKQLNGIYLVTLVLLLSVVAIFFFTGIPFSRPGYYIFSTLALMVFVLWVLLRRGFVKPTATVFILISFCAFGYLAWTEAGVRDVSFIGMTTIILLASIVLGRFAATAITIFSILLGWAMAYAEWAGITQPSIDGAINTAGYMTAVFIAVAVFANITIRNLNASLKRARTSETDLLTANRELNDLRANLEQQVEDRIGELRKTTETSQRRAEQYAAIAHIARATAVHRNPAKLLSEAVQLVAQHFKYYHVGIFLLDENRDYAVLQAANSQGGLRMLESGHKLPIGATSIVGYVISTGRARMANKVDEDAVFFNNPYLPETRSEMALPLIFGDHVIGALDVQSTYELAFTQEDLEAINVLTDQLAVAVINARLISETSRTLEEVQSAFRESLEQAWGEVSRQTHGVRYTVRGIETLKEPVDRPEIQSATEHGKVVTGEGNTVLAIPLKLRNEVIGVLNIRSSDPSKPLSEDDITLVQAIAERASLALENARLVQEAQKRAARERTIGDITSKIGASVNLRNILQTAVEELGRAMPGSEVTVQFQGKE